MTCKRLQARGAPACVQPAGLEPRARSRRRRRPACARRPAPGARAAGLRAPPGRLQGRPGRRPGRRPVAPDCWRLHAAAPACRLAPRAGLLRGWEPQATLAARAAPSAARPPAAWRALRPPCQQPPCTQAAKHVRKALRVATSHALPWTACWRAATELHVHACILSTIEQKRPCPRHLQTCKTGRAWPADYSHPPFPHRTLAVGLPFCKRGKESGTDNA